MTELKNNEGQIVADEKRSIGYTIISSIVALVALAVVAGIILVFTMGRLDAGTVFTLIVAGLIALAIGIMAVIGAYNGRKSVVVEMLKSLQGL